MRARIAAIAACVMLAYGCASTAPVPGKPPDRMKGVASWYGEEFAGRTTANGEIFDPALLTAAHRTLPFGTILDISNPKTSQKVRVRVNDRGPYIGGRVIDLSYAAAKQIGLIEPGVGEVTIDVVRIGSGEREPPVPFDVTIAEAPKVAAVPSAGDPPPVAFPLPTQPATVARTDIDSRRRVAEDGRTIEVVPREAASPRPPVVPPPARTSPLAKHYIVQVGAFSVEENATKLKERLTAIGQPAFIERDDLFRVRIGPFATRELAVEAREALEATGISAMILAE